VYIHKIIEPTGGEIGMGEISLISGTDEKRQT
jgi:hypothetical protein